MERKPKVLIATQPLLAGSAMHTVLSRDPRFETFLLPEGADPEIFAAANGVDVTVASARPATHERPVVVLLDDPVEIEFYAPEGVLRKTYEGLTALVELLWERIGQANKQIRAGPPLRSPPISPASDTPAEKGGP